MDEVELILLEETKYTADEELAETVRRDRQVHAIGALTFNTTLSAYLKNLKKTIGVKAIRQNYRGTGSKAHRRQLYVTLANGAVLDVWLNDESAELGGCIVPTGILRTVEYGTRSPVEVYAVIERRLGAYTKGLPAVE